ncbi:MAG: SOS response-associated peptidase family protein, partial [Clostridiales bacterium]|nr:SOS response-associated peptidase family protein [Clostridiales bacterium]
MCGRFYIDMAFEKIIEYYDFIESYEKTEMKMGDIFPSEKTFIIDKNQLRSMQWGMKLDFSKKLIINGRIETILEKKTFKEAAETRRIILPANAYYEWEKADKQTIKRKIRLNNQNVLSLAGIYNIIKVGNDLIESFVILTKVADEQIKSIHSRMPVIIPKGLEIEWLNSAETD